LHVHSEFSLLDGACRVATLAALARQHGMPALALTDHGNLFGAVQFYSALRDAGVKPIIGYEAYVAPGSRTERQSAGGLKEAAYHLTILAENIQGYRNLLWLASIAYLDGFYYRPRIDKEILEQHKEGLIVLSGCASSEICRMILNGKPGNAEKVASQYLEMFGKENFFIELQDNGLPQQKECLGELVKIAGKLGLGMVATNDIHYPTADDVAMHEVLLCINTGRTLEDEKRMRLGSGEFYFKSPAEMIERFGHISGAIENTVKIAERCNMEMDFKTRNFPRFHPPDGKSDTRYLRELCEQGLERRFGKAPAEVRERLEHELGVIDHMGYSSYFLIVWDMIDYALKLSVPHGLRGSGAGSMVCYLLGISDIDPVRHQLLFERFLDPQRREPPDLDIDLCEHGREEVIKYVRGEYGEECAAQIITFGTMAARGVIRDVGRVLGWPIPEVDALAKRIPGGPGVTLKRALEEDVELARDYRENERIRRLFEFGFKLEGLARHASTHAAGMVLADRPLAEFIPLCKINDAVMSQFAMGDLEKCGMLKLDLLGLRTLTIVNRALDLIEARTGRRIDLNAISLEDEKTYKLLSRGDTKSVFQLGSTGMQELLRRLKPANIADIVAVVAMYRPGPLQGGVAEDYIARRNGEKQITYLDPRLEPILQDTYGLIMYQEQIMQILHGLGGMSMADALTTIKAIGKKNAAKIAKGTAHFLEGAKKHGVADNVAAALVELIKPFAEYGFNRAHTTAYAFLAYRTAFLKANYPMEYTAAGLSCEMTHSDKLKDHVRDVRKRTNITILPPCINEGDANFTVCAESAIRFGMAGVRNVGVRAVEAITSARDKGGPFTSIYDFCERVEGGIVNRQALDSLIKAGAFDCLPGHRAQKIAVLEQAMKMGQRVQADRRRGQTTLFDLGGGAETVEIDLPAAPEWAMAEMSRYEKEALGMRLSFNPLTRYETLLEQLTTANARSMNEGRAEGAVVVGGEVVSVRPMIARNGRSMAHVEIEDMHGTIRAVVFSQQWEQYGSLLKEEAVIFATGKVDRSNERSSLLIQEIVPAAEARERLAGSVRLRLQRSQLNVSLLDELHAVCERHPGGCRVLLDISMADDSHIVVRAGRDVCVRPSDAFDREIGALVGEGSVRVVARQPVVGNGGNGRTRRRGMRPRRN